MDRRAIVRIVAVSIALATLAVSLLLVVAPRFMEPMALDWRIVADLPVAMAGVGLLVGLIWIRRITGLGEDPGPSIFRDRDEGDLLLAELRDLTLGLSVPIPGGPLPSPIRKRLTARWLVTRIELTVAMVSIVLAASSFWLPGPLVSRPMLNGSDLGGPLALVGTAGCVVGLVWMIRIARRPGDAGPTIWRSQRD